MKKILILLIAAIVLGAGGFLGYRYNNNLTSIVPYPYAFVKSSYRDIEADAPIVIIGDRMAERLATFKDTLAQKLSTNLSKPIKIVSLANEGDGVHRSFEKLKKLKRLPLVIIYFGNTDQIYESTFKTKNIEQIYKNFDLYENDYWQTLLMVFPSFSKLLYNPVPYTVLKTRIIKDKREYSDIAYQKRMGLHYKLYESSIGELFKYTKKRNSVIIPVTTPLNLKIAPKKSCQGSLAPETEEELDLLQDLFNKKDYKQAFNISKELALLNSSNSRILYLHGQIAAKLNMRNLAQEYFELAIAYDCNNHRGSPVFNAILKQQAQKHFVGYLDYHRYLAEESYRNHTFIDDVYPQDYYLEKLTDMLALKIKTLLKL